MTATENYHAAARMMDAAFIQFFKERASEEFGSGDVAKAFGVSHVVGTEG